MTMPNFLIIGAAKSGTTALYRYLAQHPDVYTSPLKDPNFFAFEGQPVDFRGPGIQVLIDTTVSNIEDYRALYQGASNEKAIGEGSTLYLYLPWASGRIRHYIPHANLIAILRHPVERAYSGFLHAIRDGVEPLTDFAQALREEQRRIASKWLPFFYYKHRGFYYAQLKRYFDLFDPSQIRVCLYEDFDSDPVGVLQDIFQFLGVEKTFIPDTSIRHNVSRTVRIPRSKKLHALLTTPNAIKVAFRLLIPGKRRQLIRNNLMNWNLVKPPLLPEVRNRLIGEYREDILRLQDLIQRDLSKWLE
jgi:hypothetical protein